MSLNAYIILMIIIVGLAIVCKVFHYISNDLFTKLAFLGMFILYGFRDAETIGIDSTGLYLSDFLEMGTKELSISSRNFLSYYLMQFVHNYVSPDYQVYIVIVAAFVTFSYYHLVKKYSDNSYISIMWFFGMTYYIFMFSALKQSIAMAILTWAFDAMMQKKPIRFIVLVLLASCFHIPALIFLPAYLISGLRLGRKYIIALGILMGVVFLYRERILNLMNSFYENGETMAMDNDTFIGNKVILMLFFIAVAFMIRRLTDSDRYYNNLLMFMGIAAVLQTYCYYNNIFERLADYYYQFSILFMALLLGEYDKKKSLMSEQSIEFVNIIGTIGITVFAFWRFSWFLNNNAEFFLPFKFFWQ